MADGFITWIDNPNPGTGGNIISPSALQLDSQREEGFKAGDPASSLRINAALRQATLVTKALMEVANSGSTNGYLDDIDDIEADIEKLGNVLKVEFTEALTRTNVASNDSLATLFGKVRKYFSDLKTFAFNALKTSQDTSTDSAPTNKLLKESTFARVYRTFYDDLGIVLSSSTTMAQICGAMIDNSEAYLQKIDAGGVDIATKFPTATNGTLHILRWNSTRTSLEYFPADDSAIKYIGYYNTNLTPVFTGWKQVANIENLSNPNLIFNSDFRINTKGLQIYTGTAYQETVDGFIKRESSDTVTVLTDGGIRFTRGSSGSSPWFCRSLNTFVNTLLLGKTLTLTAKIKTFYASSALTSVRLTMGNGNTSYASGGFDFGHVDFSSTGTFSALITIPASLTNTYLNVIFQFLNSTANDYYEIEWIKLELGNMATTYSPPIHEIEQWGAANLSDLAKPNLIYNGNFVINTRGQPQYSISSGNPIETVDGLLLYYYSSPTLTVKSGGGISISGTATGGNNVICRHNVLNYVNLAGKTVTLTIKLSNITGTGLKVRTSSTSSGTYSSIITSDTIFTTTFDIGTTPTELAITLVTASSGAYSFDVDSWKLELGDIPTEFTPTTIPIEQGALMAYNAHTTFPLSAASASDKALLTEKAIYNQFATEAELRPYTLYGIYKIGPAANKTIGSSSSKDIQLQIGSYIITTDEPVEVDSTYSFAYIQQYDLSSTPNIRRATSQRLRFSKGAVIELTVINAYDSMRIVVKGLTNQDFQDINGNAVYVDEAITDPVCFGDNIELRILNLIVSNTDAYISIYKLKQ